MPDVCFAGSPTAAVEESVVGSCCLGHSLGSLGVLDRRLGDVEGHVRLGPGAAELLEQTVALLLTRLSSQEIAGHSGDHHQQEDWNLDLHVDLLLRSETVEGLNVAHDAPDRYSR